MCFPSPSLGWESRFPHLVLPLAELLLDQHRSHHQSSGSSVETKNLEIWGSFTIKLAYRNKELSSEREHLHLSPLLPKANSQL